ncbi:MAG: alpha/beta hydrolase [Dermatophilaceae bacterium]
MTRPLWRPRRRVATLLTAVVASLSLSSCLVLPFVGPDSADTPGPTALPTGVSTPPPGQPGLAPFYAQQLQWRKCSGADCAKLKVPVDYNDPGGSTIELAVLRVTASNSSQRIGSLVVNPGGPGGSGVDYARAASQIVGAEVRRRFDVVGFDPRGVGESAPIDCLTDADLDTFLAMDPTPDDATEERAFVDEAKVLADGCKQRGGALLAHVSTEDAARDMDVLRAVLGEAKLNYLGKSYGTYLGATYADLFPLNVGRFVLDGVVSPDLSSAEVSEGQARGFDLATRAYVTNCVKRSDCPVGSTVEEGMQWIRDFLARLDSQPLPVTGDARVKSLTEGWGSMGIGYAMYAQSLWPSLTQALRSAKNGDGSQLMDLAYQYADRTSSGRYTSNIMEVIYAVNCLDKPDTADIPTVEKNAADFAKVAPTWGRMLAWGSVPCGVWPIQTKKVPKKISAAGSGPIVVVGTTRDPATIYEWSVRLRNQLSNAVLISYDGDGHTAYTRSNACVDKPIDAYYVSGTVPQDGLKC